MSSFGLTAYTRIQLLKALSLDLATSTILQRIHPQSTDILLQTTKTLADLMGYAGNREVVKCTKAGKEHTLFGVLFQLTKGFFYIMKISINAKMQ